MPRLPILACLLLAAPALAQPAPAAPDPMTAPMPGHGPVPDSAMTTPGAAASTPSSRAFQAAMERMMAGMGRPFSGDTDRDFVSGMLAHHQGAVEMAQIELHYGRDPAMKRLARQIITAQQREIGVMRRWQATHAH